jgi:mono/diheme cytochrome c family protein
MEREGFSRAKRSPDVKSLVIVLFTSAIVAEAALMAQETASRVPTSPVTGNAVKGKKLYYDYACYSCHGYTGETGARPFVPNWTANLATEQSFITFLRARANVAPVEPSTRMPNYAAETLNDADAKDIYAYIRTFKSHAPPLNDIPVLKQILSGAQKP